MSKADAMKRFLADPSMKEHPHKHDYAMEILYSTVTGIIMKEAAKEAAKVCENLDEVLSILDKANELDTASLYICHQTDQWAEAIEAGLSPLEI